MRNVLVFTFLVNTVSALSETLPFEYGDYYNRDENQVLVSMESYAYENAWKLESQRMISATSKNQIEEVIERYPEILGAGFSMSEINYITIEEKNFAYTALHTCEENDPRLRFTFGAWKVCLNNGSCMSPLSMPRFIQKDPCSLNFSLSNRPVLPQ